MSDDPRKTGSKEPRRWTQHDWNGSDSEERDAEEVDRTVPRYMPPPTTPYLDIPRSWSQSSASSSSPTTPHSADPVIFEYAEEQLKPRNQYSGASDDYDKVYTCTTPVPGKTDLADANKRKDSSKISKSKAVKMPPKSGGKSGKGRLQPDAKASNSGSNGGESSKGGGRKSQDPEDRQEAIAN